MSTSDDTVGRGDKGRTGTEDSDTVDTEDVDTEDVDTEDVETKDTGAEAAEAEAEDVETEDVETEDVDTEDVDTGAEAEPVAAGPVASPHEVRLREAGIEFPDKPEGPIAAAILAGGVGSLALGVLTTLSEASTQVHDWLELSEDVGPLSGKTVGAVLVWLVAWVVLHVSYRDKPFETRRALTIALVLVALGVVGTFPTFFQAFASE